MPRSAKERSWKVHILAEAGKFRVARIVLIWDHGATPHARSSKMPAKAKRTLLEPPTVANRVDALDLARISQELDGFGCATTGPLLGGGRMR